MIVTPGTSWKWNSRSGVTPSCAASVVPGSERDRRRQEPPQPLADRRCQRHHAGGGRHRELEPDRPDEPRVEDQRARGPPRPGSSRSRAACRSARPRARSWPSRPRASPTARHRSSRRRRRPCRRPRPNRGQRVSRSSEASPSDRRQHHGDVLARDHQQVAEPARLEVAHHAGVQPRCVAQRQPEQQPRLLRREEPRDRPADERSEHLRRTDERARRRPEAFDGVAVQLDDHPLVRERIAERRDRRAGGSRPRRETTSPRTQPRRVVVGAQPQRCAQRRGARPTTRPA